MGKLRFYFALWSAKAVLCLLRILGKNATYFPGKLALKLCGDFLYRIGRPDTLIGVTGTNGKTTVSNLLADVLSERESAIVNNRYGSNIDAGVASALIDAASIGGKCRLKLGVLEMDERSAAKIFPALKPDWLIVTNLFRDSMRRNAHPEYIAGLLNANIPPTTKLILNADELISSSLMPLNYRAYFGIDPLPDEPPVRDNIVIDARICPLCGGRLEYDFRRYNHIGRAHCPQCGFKSAEPYYRMVSAGTVLEKDGVWHDYTMHADAVYNMYNMLAVIALLREMGYAKDEISASFEKLEIVQSRYWSENIGGKELTQIMAKGLNAVACSRSFDFVANAAGKKTVVLMLDDVFDEKNSSENIAWLYDADFDFLAGDDIIQVVAVGVRCLDTRLRLLIGGVDDARICAVESAEDAAAAADISADRIFVLYELYRHDSAVKLRDKIAERLRGL